MRATCAELAAASAGTCSGAAGGLAAGSLQAPARGGTGRGWARQVVVGHEDQVGGVGERARGVVWAGPAAAAQAPQVLDVHDRLGRGRVRVHPAVCAVPPAARAAAVGALEDR